MHILIKCLYFQVPNGVLSFRRYRLPESCLPKWADSNESLCKLHVTKNKTIEDMDGLLQVNIQRLNVTNYRFLTV